MTAPQTFTSRLCTPEFFGALLLSLAILAASGCRGGGADDVEAAPSPLGREEVGEGFLLKEAGVEGCVSRARTRNPRVFGAVVVEGTIDIDGRVEEARVARSSTGDRLLDDCVLAETRLARFPSAGVQTPFEHEWTVSRSSAPRRSQPREQESAFAQSSTLAPEDPEGPPPMRGESIRQLADQDAEAINACYAGAVEGRPDVEGSIRVSWAIDPSGSIRSAVVTGGSLEDEAVGDCIIQRVRSWRFAPTGGAGLQQASYTWNFRQE